MRCKILWNTVTADMPRIVFGCALSIKILNITWQVTDYIMFVLEEAMQG